MRSLVLVLLGVFGAELALAQDFGSLGRPIDSPVVGFELSHESPSDGNPALSIREQRLSFAAPAAEGVSLSVRGIRTVLGESLRFEKRAIEVPQEFGMVELGGSYSHLLESGNRRSYNLTYGTAGKRILDNGLTPIIGGTFAYEKNVSETRSWVYVVNYSNTRVILNHIPLPGFAYIIKEKTRTIMLGIPFVFGNWRYDPIYLSAVVSPFAASTDGAYRFWGPLMAYGTVSWQPRAYQNVVQGSEDRLIYDKREVGAGVRAIFGPKGNISLGWVRSFHRRFMIARSVSDEDADVISVEATTGFETKFRWTF